MPWLLALLSFAPGPVRASLLSGEALDTAADIIAIVVLFIVPIVAVTVFWLVHILPEVIAEKRHHPQQDAVKTLCLLSLVFGGLLWPLAWILAYTRPVAYRLAYGTDKHDNYFHEKADAAAAGKLTHEEVANLKRELDAIAERRVLSLELLRARDAFNAALAREAVTDAKGSAA